MPEVVSISGALKTFEGLLNLVVALSKAVSAANKDTIKKVVRQLYFHDDGAIGILKDYKDHHPSHEFDNNEFLERLAKYEPCAREAFSVILSQRENIKISLKLYLFMKIVVYKKKSLREELTGFSYEMAEGHVPPEEAEQKISALITAIEALNEQICEAEEQLHD